MSKVRPVDVSSRPGTASTLARLSLSRSESGKSLGKLHITPKRSKFFIMDADGHYVDTERGRRWGVLSRFSSAKLEHDFKRYEEGVWRSGYELQFSLVCMLALSGCGLVNAASLHPSSWATTRIVTASLSILLCISVLVMSRWMKLLGILTVQAVIALLTVLSCMSSSHSYSFVSTSLVVLANVRAPCAELLPTALFAVTVAGCVAFQALDKGMDPVALQAASLALLVIIAVAAIAFRIAQGAPLREAYTELCISRGKRQSLALESSRRKASTGSRDQDHGRRSVASNQTNYADGPIQTVLEELRVVAESNPSLASLINELSQLLTKSHAWEPVLRDSFAVRQQMLIGAGSTSTDDPVVDEETAVWLEQMLTPWHKQVGNGFEKELLISRGHSVAEKSPTSSTRGPVSQATSVTVPPVHASQSTVEVNSDAPVDGPGTGKKARRLSAIRVSGSGRFTVVPEPVISAAVENPLIRLLARSDEPDFEVEALEPYTSAQPLLCMVMYYVNTYSIAESLSLDLPTLKRFLIQTEGAYRPLPYHSNLHAADVVTNAMRLLKRSEHPVTLQPLELLAILVSCAVHDMDHPGVNNAFLTSTNHEIALQHNDQSVLENHHLFRAFTTLQSEGCNFLRDMSYAQIQRFRHIVIELVLSTDFAFHLKLVNQFKMLVSGMPDKAALTSADDKLLMWRIIMKTADLGHCCKPFTLHRRWAYRVMEEMYRQGEMERELDFTVSAAMDRHKLVLAAKSQAGFLEFVCLPLFQAWTLFSYDASTLQLVEDNIRGWKEMDARGEYITDADIASALPEARHFKSRKTSAFRISRPTRTSNASDSMDLDGLPTEHLEDILPGQTRREVMRAKERPDVGDFSSLKFGAAVMVSVAGNKLLKAARKSLKGKGELGGDTDNHGASDANVLGRDSPGRRSWTNTSHINLRGSTASDAPPETVRVVRHTSVDSAIPPSTRHPLAPKTSMSPPKADTGDVRSVEPSLSEMPREPRRSSHSGLRSAGSVRGSFLGRSPVETVDPAWLTDLAQASSRDLSAVPARLRAPQSTRKISYQLSFSSKGLQFIDSEKE